MRPRGFDFPKLRKNCAMREQPRKKGSTTFAVRHHGGLVRVQFSKRLQLQNILMPAVHADCGEL